MLRVRSLFIDMPQHSVGVSLIAEAMRHQIDGIPNPMVEMAHLHAVGMRALLSRQREMLEFFEQRCDRNMHLFDAMAKVKEPRALMELMTEFYRSAAKEYATEMSKAAETLPKAAGIAGEMLGEGIETLRKTQAPAKAA